MIALESARLSRLVDNLLDLSRLQAGGVEPRRTGARSTRSCAPRSSACPRPPGGFDVQLDARPAAGQRRRRPARARARQRARERGRFAGGRAGDDPGARGRAASCCCGSATAARASRGRSSSASSSPSTARGEQRRAAGPRAWRSRAASWRPTAGRIRAESLPGQGTTLRVPAAGARRAPARSA